MDSHIRLKCLTIPTNQSLILFRRYSHEHGKYDESEKAKQMVKKEVNINPVQMDTHIHQSSSTRLNLKMTSSCYVLLFSGYHLFPRRSLRWSSVDGDVRKKSKKENMEQFNLDMLKDEHMRQQYAVEVNNIFDCLEHEVTEQEYEKDRVDILWTNIKEGIQKAAHSILPKIVKKNKKPWISTDILDMMEKRKRAKNTQSYDEINRQVKRACKIAK